MEVCKFRKNKSVLNSYENDGLQVCFDFLSPISENNGWLYYFFSPWDLILHVHDRSHKKAVEVYFFASRSDEVIHKSLAKIVLENEIRQSSISETKR